VSRRGAIPLRDVIGFGLRRGWRQRPWRSERTGQPPRPIGDRGRQFDREQHNEQDNGRWPSATRRAQTTAYVKLKYACAKAEIVPGVSPHDLRRTHASLAAESGMSLQIIQQCLGHSSARTTERHYAFIRNNVVTGAVKQFPTLPLPANVTVLRPQPVTPDAPRWSSASRCCAPGSTWITRN
jgi:integrase